MHTVQISRCANNPITRAHFFQIFCQYKILFCSCKENYQHYESLFNQSIQMKEAVFVISIRYKVNLYLDEVNSSNVNEISGQLNILSLSIYENNRSHHCNMCAPSTRLIECQVVVAQHSDVLLACIAQQELKRVKKQLMQKQKEKCAQRLP